LRNAHGWLDELIKDPYQTVAGIAACEQKSERSIRMTLSLAFVAPPIVAAAIEGPPAKGIRIQALDGFTDGEVAPMDRAGLKAPA
jgi:site-specific DNA recombinase